MIKGKAAVFFGPGKPFQIREITLPEIEPDAVAIRVSLANVCGSDLHFWRGDAPLRLPEDGWIFGHEMMGRVAALGKNVKNDSLGRPLKDGDRVAYTYFYPCGRCYVCLNKEPANCPAKIERPRGPAEFPHFHGAFAEYYYLRPGGHLFKVPDELSDELVSPVNCALSQVIYGLHQAGLRFGGSVVIQGAGGLGIQAVAVAKDMGAATVIVVDQIPGRLELARAFGADHTLSAVDLPTADRRVEAVKELTGGFGADVVADLVGYPDVIPEGLRMLRGGGCYLEVGSIAPGNLFSYDATALVRGNVRFVATSNYSPWALDQSLAFLRRNLRRFPFERIVSHVFPLERISEGFRQADWLRHQNGSSNISRAAISM